MLEGRDKVINDTLVSIDQFWLKSLDSFNGKFKAMDCAQTDMEKSMPSEPIEPQEKQRK